VILCVVVLQLTDAVFKALHTGGNVLIPSDSAGRVLEVALRLDIAWQALPHSLLSRGQPGLYVVSYTGTKTVLFDLV
jgi:Cft2 family RNA processing exonuclease